jgi:thiamine-phosphate pyrophosphorylase
MPSPPADLLGPTDPASRLLVVADTSVCRGVGRSVAELAEQALEGGARLFWYRNRVDGAGLALQEAQALVRLLHPAGARLLVGERADVALAAGADGVHLSSHGMPVEAIRRLGGLALIGRSCHDLSELGASTGADYVTLSPVFPVRSPKPPEQRRAPLGLETLAALAGSAPAPVFALGGVAPTDPEGVAACLQAGAHGVAVLGGIGLADSPTAAVAALLATLARCGGMS